MAIENMNMQIPFKLNSLICERQNDDMKSQVLSSPADIYRLQVTTFGIIPIHQYWLVANPTQQTENSCVGESEKN